MATISLEHNVKVKSKKKCDEIIRVLNSTDTKIAHISDNVKIATKEESLEIMKKWLEK